MSKPGKAAPPKDFESALGELEALVEKMETGELSLEAALAAYQRGMVLTSFCQKLLNAAEQQVKLLENGQLKDFSADPNASGHTDV